MWKIKNIYEADRTSSVLAHCEQCAVTSLRESCEGASHDCAWGCEERQPGAKLRVLVELVNEYGETKTIAAYDEYLTWNHIDVGSVWEEPDEEKKALFFKQKHTMDTFLSTGALTKEQYDFSLSGLVVKMGFDFDILKEEE